MKKLVKTNYINGIKEAFESGMQELQTACELYVQAIDEDPAWKESIHAELELTAMGQVMDLQEYLEGA